MSLTVPDPTKTPPPFPPLQLQPQLTELEWICELMIETVPDPISYGEIQTPPPYMQEAKRESPMSAQIQFQVSAARTS